MKSGLGLGQVKVEHRVTLIQGKLEGEKMLNLLHACPTHHNASHHSTIGKPQFSFQCVAMNFSFNRLRKEITIPFLKNAFFSFVVFFPIIFLLMKVLLPI